MTPFPSFLSSSLSSSSSSSSSLPSLSPSTHSMQSTQLIYTSLADVPHAKPSLPHLSHSRPHRPFPKTLDTAAKAGPGPGSEPAATAMPTPPPSAGAIAPPPFSAGNGPSPPVALSPAMLGSRLRPSAPPPIPADTHLHDSLSPVAVNMPPLPRALPPPPSPSATSAHSPAMPASPAPNATSPVDASRQRIPTVPMPVSIAPINIANLPTPTSSSPADSSTPSPTSPLRIPPRTKSRGPPSPPAPAASAPSAVANDTRPSPPPSPPSCPHDSFLCPSATGSPLCKQCQAPVARLKAMHAAFLDMRDARDELASRLATREAQLARIEAEAARSYERANELEDQADTYLDRALQAESRVTELEACVRELRERAEAEHARADALASEKEAVENELEDLSQQLFEQANSMVSDEARRHDHAMRELRARVEAAEVAAHDERQQCQELKRMVEQLERERERDELKVKELEKMHQFLAPPMPGGGAVAADASRPGSWASNYSGHYTSSNRSSFVHSSASPALAASPPPEVDLDAIDSYALEDFLDFMSSAPSVPLAKCATLPFLERALAADLNPCLAFSAPKAPTPQALVAAMLQGELEVDAHSPSKTPASPRVRQGSNDSGISSGQEESPAATNGGGGFFSFMTRSAPTATATVTPAPQGTLAAPAKCTLCANHSSMPFVLHLGSASSSGGGGKQYPMCAFCRDRVVAAADFVAFARNLRAGLFTRQSLGKVWADSLALRSRLGYARLGSLAAVDGPQSVGVGLAAAASAVANATASAD